MEMENAGQIPTSGNFARNSAIWVHQPCGMACRSVLRRCGVADAAVRMSGGNQGRINRRDATRKPRR